MRNVTPTSVWGRLSFLQFRVAVMWQLQVVKCLRRILAEDPPREPWLQDLLDTFVVPREARVPFIWKSVAPEEPTNLNINHGFSKCCNENPELWTRTQDDPGSALMFFNNLVVHVQRFRRPSFNP